MGTSTMNTAGLGTMSIDINALTNYTTFNIRNKVVCVKEAIQYIESSRAKNIADFNTARVLKVVVNNKMISLLDLMRA